MLYNHVGVALDRLINNGQPAELAALETELTDLLDRVQAKRSGMPDLPALATPRGYIGVEWADGTVHAIDLDDLGDGPLWREPVVCGRAGPGVSSDEGGHAALHQPAITCLDCVSILA